MTITQYFPCYRGLEKLGFTPYALNKIAYHGIELIDVTPSFKLKNFLEEKLGTEEKKDNAKPKKNKVVQKQKITGLEALVLFYRCLNQGLWVSRKFSEDKSDYQHIYTYPDYPIPLFQAASGNILAVPINKMIEDPESCDQIFSHYGGSEKYDKGFILQVFCRTDLKEYNNGANTLPTTLVGAKIQGNKLQNLVGLSPEPAAANVNSIYQYDLSLCPIALYTQLTNTVGYTSEVPWVVSNDHKTIAVPVCPEPEKYSTLKNKTRKKTPAGKLGYAPDKVGVKAKFKSKGLPKGAKVGTRVYSNPELFPELSPTFQGLSYWLTVSGTTIYLELTNTNNQTYQSIPVLNTRLSIENDQPKLVPIPLKPTLDPNLGVGKTLDMGKLVTLYYKVTKPVKVKELEESNLILGGTKYSIPHFTREIMQAHFLGLDLSGQWKRLRYGDSYLSPYCDGEYITLQPPAILTSDNIAEYRKLSGDSRTPLEIWEGVLKGESKIKSFQDETLRRIQQQPRIQDRTLSDSPLTQQLISLGYDLDNLTKQQIKDLKFKLKRGML
jgi:hypothetical protein